MVSSCSVSRKLAADFVNKESYDVAVLLLPAMYLDYMQKDAADKLYPITTTTPGSSKLLPQVSDSIFMESYYNTFINHLEQTNIQVFTSDQMTDFLNFKGKAYVAEMAQMELVESTYQQQVDELRSGVSKSRLIALTEVRLNVWLDISAQNASQNAKHTYYDEQTIQDELNGDFVEDPIKNDAIYYYEIEALKKEDIYEWATELGQIHAEYLYDLMMNTYIWNHLSPKQQGYHLFLHYNPHYQVIERADAAFEML